MPEIFGKRERDKSRRAHSGLKNRVSRQAPICQKGASNTSQWQQAESSPFVAFRSHNAMNVRSLFQCQRNAGRDTTEGKSRIDPFLSSH